MIITDQFFNNNLLIRFINGRGKKNKKDVRGTGTPQ